MSYWVLTISGKVISCVTVQQITTAEMNTEEYMAQMKRYDDEIQKCLNVQGIDLSQKASQIPDWNRLSLDEDDPNFQDEFQRVINDDSIPDADNQQKQHEPIIEPYVKYGSRSTTRE